MLTFVVLVLIAIPMILALGLAWTRLLTGEDARSPQYREAARYSVFVLAVLPILTLWTLWPLRLAFLAARPGMEVLADQVAAGPAIGFGFPRRVGLFWVISFDIYPPADGYVGLMIARQPRTGFVRLHPRSTRNSHGPIVGSHFDVYLGGGWWYRG